MTYLIMEILLYLAAAFVLGIAIGWLIWGWRAKREVPVVRASAAAATADLARPRSASTKSESTGPNTEDTFGPSAKIAALESRLSDCNSARSRLEGELDALKRDRVAMETELATGRANLAACTETRSALEAQLAELRQDTATPVATTDAPPPATLLAERPAEVDDLKIIKGVGPKMEGILNGKGIYLFRQVANFTPRDVEWVNAAIEAFPGRIERDEWVRQAQELYREKYGKRHDED